MLQFQSRAVASHITIRPEDNLLVHQSPHQSTNFIHQFFHKCFQWRWPSLISIWNCHGCKWRTWVAFVQCMLELAIPLRNQRKESRIDDISSCWLIHDKCNQLIEALRLEGWNVKPIAVLIASVRSKELLTPEPLIADCPVCKKPENSDF